MAYCKHCRSNSADDRFHSGTCENCGAPRGCQGGYVVGEASMFRVGETAPETVVYTSRLIDVTSWSSPVREFIPA
jgi:hypothetical protein